MGPSKQYIPKNPPISAAGLLGTDLVLSVKRKEDAGFLSNGHVGQFLWQERDYESESARRRPLYLNTRRQEKVSATGKLAALQLHIF